jgi:hypothetical protein
MTDLVGKQVKVEIKRGEETSTGFGVVLAFEPRLLVGDGENTVKTILKVGWKTSQCKEYIVDGDSTFNIGRNVEWGFTWPWRVYKAPNMSRNHAKIEVQDGQLILTPVANNNVYILKWNLLNKWAEENDPILPKKSTQENKPDLPNKSAREKTPAPVFEKVEGSVCLADGDQVFMGNLDLDIFKDEKTRRNYIFKVEKVVRIKRMFQCTKGRYLVKIGGTEEDAKLGAEPFVEYFNSRIKRKGSSQNKDVRKRKFSDVECTGLAPWRGYMMLKREQIKVV